MVQRPLVSAKQTLLFNFVKFRKLAQIWLYENTELKIEGYIIGFDEYMNLVVDEAVEVIAKKNIREPIGRILLKGDNLALVREV